MPSCLGLYIEPNLIKYAKVSKEKDNVKVEAYGIKFYDNFSETLDQIIEETYSFKIPVSINLSEEMYNYFNIFRLLKEKDYGKIISNEFEFLCEEKGYNVNTLEQRYTIVSDIENRENLKVIHVSANKTEIIKRTQQLDRYRLTGIVPLPISITNLVDFGSKDNAIIINTEEKTSITTIINGKIYRIDNLDIGMGDILAKINVKENSFAKSYEICKNTTIYTSEGLSGAEETNEYLEDIMPILYNIVTEVKRIYNESIVTIDKIYITGSMSTINNIDLYFEQNISNTTCQVLKPHFLNNLKTNVNIKDYIEVNSATSIALLAMGEGVKEVNFKRTSAFEGLKLTSGQKDGKTSKKSKGINFSFSLKGELDAVDKNLLRSTGGILTLLIVYIVIATVLYGMINLKKKEADTRLIETNAQLNLATADINKVREVSDKYVKLKQNLDDLNAKIEEKYRNKNNIPNLLNKIMFIIPEGVQLTSIENTTNKHIVIKAQAAKYEQLGYFKAKLKSDDILLNVISDSGYKQDSVIKVTIEGDLP